MPTAAQMPEGGKLTQRALRTPRSAAIAGIIFAVLLITALILIRVAVPQQENQSGAWLSDKARRNSTLLALDLVPFAAIAFLWFIGVVRDRIGDAEDRFFATVFLGSGLLFVAMLFVASASLSGIIAGAGDGHGGVESAQLWRFGHQVASTSLNVYAMRMAAVFMISTSTILLRGGIMPRWIALSGYAIAVVLLLTVGFFKWIELLFPLWVLLVSTSILIETYRSDQFAPIVTAPTE